MTAKVAILGCSGWVSHYLAPALIRRIPGVKVIGTYNTRNPGFDFPVLPWSSADPNRLIEWLEREQITTIVNMTRGETDGDFALHRKLIDLCNNREAHYCYASSFNACDAQLVHDHLESELPSAQSEYGNFKARCELALMDHSKSFAIFRFTATHGWAPNRIARTEEFLLKMSSGQLLTIERGILRNRTAIMDLTEMMAAVVGVAGQGIFHLGTIDASDEIDFLRRLAAEFGQDASLIVPGEASPRNANMVPGRIFELFGNEFRRTEEDTITAVGRVPELARYRTKSRNLKVGLKRNYHFREAIRDDGPALKKIRDNVTENALRIGTIEEDAYISAFFIEGKAWACERDGELIGFSCGRPEKRDVWALFIKKEHEGRGIGNKLMELLETWMFSRGCTSIELRTEPGTRAERLYRRRGWLPGGLSPHGEREFTLFSRGHLPTREESDSLPDYSAEKPLRILVSACLGGKHCGVDGSSNGDHPWIRNLMALQNVKTLTFCPEDFSFGTPRNLPDIHGGNGFDVLDGKARVLTDQGEDWTQGMIRAAKEMLRIAQDHRIDIAVLMDISAACGSQVIYDGCRRVEDRNYQKGPGVAAAMLLRNGFRVVSQRDFRTLEHLYRKLDPSHQINEQAIDHHETEWFRSYFGPQEALTK